MAKIIRREPKDGTTGFMTYPVVQCDCGAEVECITFWSNECDCGTEYNGAGQTLAPRHQWGEETGEVF